MDAFHNAALTHGGRDNGAPGERAYHPGTFIPEWIYGGKKHGRSLRYKKSRAFCTFLPNTGCSLSWSFWGGLKEMNSKRGAKA